MNFSKVNEKNTIRINMESYIQNDKSDFIKLINSNLTKQEKDEGAELCWLLPEVALEYIKKSYDKLIPSKYSDLYNSKMVIKRDELILEYYLKNKERTNI